MLCVHIAAAYACMLYGARSNNMCVYIAAHIHSPTLKSTPIPPTPPEMALPVNVFPVI